jgi:Lrp/AsnC family leucine-responsive transcriptional regulator
VALSPTAVLARVQRLTKDGYILGYEARLNPLKLGRGMMVFRRGAAGPTTPNVFDAFKAAVQVRPDIMECHMVAGGFDYLLKTRMADMTAYREFAGTVLWQLPGVRETRTYAVMEEVKNTTTPAPALTKGRSLRCRAALAETAVPTAHHGDAGKVWIAVCIQVGNSCPSTGCPAPGPSARR